MGSITSKRPSEIEYVYGRLSNKVYGIVDKERQPDQFFLHSLEERTEKDLSDIEVREIIKELGDELIKVNDAIFQYRKIRPSASVSDDESYNKAMENVNKIIKRLPESVARPYMILRDDYLKEAQELSKRAKIQKIRCKTKENYREKFQENK